MFPRTNLLNIHLFIQQTFTQLLPGSRHNRYHGDNREMIDYCPFSPGVNRPDLHIKISRLIHGTWL